MKHPSIFGGKDGVFGSAGSSEVFVDLNLTPLMDVMSNILFFLLASFGAAILSFMAASVPTEADSDTVTTDPPRTDKVIANVQFRSSDYRLNLAGDNIPAEQLEALTRVLPKTATACRDGMPSPCFDNDALRRWAWDVKQKFPGSDTAVIVPGDSTIYDEIIGAMEVLRYYPVEDQKKVKMFSKLVIADLVKGDAKE